MIRLNQTASQLLSLVTTQNGATCVVSYSDKTATTYVGDTQVTAIASATTTTICSTPAASTIRDVDHLTVRNTFAGNQEVTLQLSSSATLYPLVTITLSQGDSLEYTHGSGFRVIDANGQVKSTPFAAMTSTQLAGLITDETGSGSLVFATSPTLVTPLLGTPTSGDLRNCSLAVAPAIGGTTPSTGAFTNLSSIATGTNASTTAISESVSVDATTNGTYNITGLNISAYQNNTTATAGVTNSGTLRSINADTFLRKDTGTLNSIIGTTQSYGVYGPAAAQVAGTIASATGLQLTHYNQGTATITLSKAINISDSGTQAGTNTTKYGILVNSLAGSTVYGIASAITAGAGKWNFYESGGANNAFSGNTRFGGVTAPVATVDVTGNVLATTSILSSGALSGVGYAAGAGGTATQGVSKATGVTIAKACGTITMHNANLAADTTVTFLLTITGATIAATDQLILSHTSGGTFGAYVLNARYASATTMNIDVHNCTPGALAEAIVIQYSLFRSVAA